MSCAVTSLSFVFFLISLGAEALAFLTSYMVLNRLEPGLHDGIFQRCGAMSYFKSALNVASSIVQKITDDSLTLTSACTWWSPRVFETDERNVFKIS